MNVHCTVSKQPLYTLLHPRCVQIIVIIVLNSGIVRDLPPPPPCWIFRGAPLTIRLTIDKVCGHVENMIFVFIIMTVHIHSQKWVKYDKYECALHCTVCKQPVYTFLHPRHVKIIVLVFIFTLTITIATNAMWSNMRVCVFQQLLYNTAPQDVFQALHTIATWLYLKRRGDSHDNCYGCKKTAPLWLEDQIKSGRILGQIVAPSPQ